jgi:hypothetical protein
MPLKYPSSERFGRVVVLVPFSFSVLAQLEKLDCGILVRLAPGPHVLFRSQELKLVPISAFHARDGVAMESLVSPRKDIMKLEVSLIIRRHGQLGRVCVDLRAGI